MRGQEGPGGPRNECSRHEGPGGARSGQERTEGNRRGQADPFLENYIANREVVLKTETLTLY